MKYRFNKHYSLEEARALLPQVRVWLKQLVRYRDCMQEEERRVQPFLARGDDVGGASVNRWIEAVALSSEVFSEFHRREILVKDLDRGLIDFPAILGGREVFLCWEQDEGDIEYWHDLESGYAGREKL